MEIYDPLVRYVRRRSASSDVDDVVADVLLIVWRRLDEIPYDRVLPWAYGTARRVLANRRRSDRRHLQLIEKMQSQPEPTPEPDPSETGPDPEMSAALASLGETEREIIRLWAWEQLEPREIATVLGTTTNAATLRLSRARSKLKKQLIRQRSGSSGHEPVEGTQEIG